MPDAELVLPGSAVVESRAHGVEQRRYVLRLDHAEQLSCIVPHLFRRDMEHAAYALADEREAHLAALPVLVLEQHVGHPAGELFDELELLLQDVGGLHLGRHVHHHAEIRDAAVTVLMAPHAAAPPVDAAVRMDGPVLDDAPVHAAACRQEDRKVVGVNAAAGLATRAHGTDLVEIDVLQSAGKMDGRTAVAGAPVTDPGQFLGQVVQVELGAEFFIGLRQRQLTGAQRLLGHTLGGDVLDVHQDVLLAIHVHQRAVEAHQAFAPVLEMDDGLVVPQAAADTQGGHGRFAAGLVGPVPDLHHGMADHLLAGVAGDGQPLLVDVDDQAIGQARQADGLRAFVKSSAEKFLAMAPLTLQQLPVPLTLLQTQFNLAQSGTKLRVLVLVVSCTHERCRSAASRASLTAVPLDAVLKCWRMLIELGSGAPRLRGNKS